ncbi:hypothetical protein AJ80_06194 [Polytolypa hystricis UAMH7299]|uniref:Uncharacterized protein n=1 Tax=Polytolypa hystricis (strain UAMH7299) TaxID=1447883 RepID=A0A2B7XX66_POLH7|nr:hypothetical protein AJ80_06194 [Polytolypa hystricis UAMH7299]
MSMRRRQLKPQTPKFDPDRHRSPVKAPSIDDYGSDDSFVQSIITRSPSKHNLRGKQQNGAARPSLSSDPHRLNLDFTRVEDPLDAIDALEDALEQIGNALPTVEDHTLDSPVRAGTPTDIGPPRKAVSKEQLRANPTRSARTSRREAVTQEPTRTQRLRNNGASQVSAPKSRPAIKSGRPKSVLIDPADTAISTQWDNPSSASINRTMSRKSSHPTLSSNTTLGPNRSQTGRPRPASICLSNTSKPPMRPTFELPGEAISRRQRAEWEERLTKVAEEAQQKKEFKARHPRLSSTPSIPVKETISSRIRANLKADDAQNRMGSTPRKPTLARNPSIGKLVPSRTSSLHTASTDTTATTTTTPPRARTDVRMNQRSVSVSPGTPLSSVNGPSLHRCPSFNKSPSGVSTTNTDPLIQRSRGREIFDRERQQEQERERERREKEEAAKRARVEAAERGRQASREWAERQRLKAKSSKRSLNDMRRDQQVIEEE